MVRDAMQRVLGPDRTGAYAPDVPVMEMGLGSLDLLELRHLLSEKSGIEIESTFFFQHATPAAIARFLAERLGSKSCARE